MSIHASVFHLWPLRILHCRLCLPCISTPCLRSSSLFTSLHSVLYAIGGLKLESPKSVLNQILVEALRSMIHWRWMPDIGNHKVECDTLVCHQANHFVESVLAEPHSLAALCHLWMCWLETLHSHQHGNIHLLLLAQLIWVSTTIQIVISQPSCNWVKNEVGVNRLGPQRWSCASHPTSLLGLNQNWNIIIHARSCCDAMVERMQIRRHCKDWYGGPESSVDCCGIKSFSSYHTAMRV